MQSTMYFVSAQPVKTAAPKRMQTSTRRASIEWINSLIILVLPASCQREAELVINRPSIANVQVP